MTAAVLALWLTAPAAAMSPATVAAIPEGLRAMYNLDFDQARAATRRLIVGEPENPYGYLFEAGVIWWQSDSEYALFKDTPALEGLFESDVQDALKKADAVLKAGGSDETLAETHFAMGMILGTRGQWDLTHHHPIKAYFDGRKAVKHLRVCLKRDPEFYDAYLGIGIYEYQAAVLPGILKIPALLMVRGNREEGLAQMRVAAEKGRYASNQALEYLADAYLLEEKDYAKALELIRTLRGRFPESSYFQFLEAIALYRLGDFAGSYRLMGGLVDKARVDPSMRGKLLTSFCGLYGRKCLDGDSLSEALDWLDRALAVEASPPSSKASLWRFLRATVYDLMGRREEAARDFDEAAGGMLLSDARSLARRCAGACARQEVVDWLKAVALEK